jgi:integrase/recombinase XerD
MGRPLSRVADVRVPPPLGCYAAEFRVELLAAGYTPLSAVTQLRLMVHVSRWLAARGLAAVDLSSERVEEYLAGRRAAGYTGLLTRRGLTPLLGFLAGQGAAPVAEPPGAPVSAVQTLLGSFERYLLAERGLAASTVAAYVGRAGWFLAEYTCDGDVGALTAADVTRVVLAECTSRSVGAGQYFVAALRSFLRFCYVEGLVEVDLSAAALGVTGRRASLLPKQISSGEAEALLRCCDRRTAVGRRDFAVLLVLLRLGLRAGEVAGLRLDDIDWRRGQVVVRGKGRCQERLPLPADVGEAIAGYLQHARPAAPGREVFISAIAPWSGLTRGAVSLIVRRACVRAGITAVGAHRLRHSLACAMVRAQVPLAQIGQVLRHRSPISTANYARVDLDQLRSLAEPWPGAGGSGAGGQR